MRKNQFLSRGIKEKGDLTEFQQIGTTPTLNIYELLREVDSKFPELGNNNHIVSMNFNDTNNYSTMITTPQPPKFPQSKPPAIIEEEICDCPDFLIVDDNAFNIYTLSLILEAHLPQSKYHSAYNGEEAVSLVRTRLSKHCGCGRRQYPIIFMDISMPVLDGY